MSYLSEVQCQKRLFKAIKLITTIRRLRGKTTTRHTPAQVDQAWTVPQHNTLTRAQQAVNSFYLATNVFLSNIYEIFKIIFADDSNSSSASNDELAAQEKAIDECQALLSNINIQQTILEDQSNDLDVLLKNIENYEISMLHLNQQNESLKVTLNNLELLNCLNSTKLNEMERETSEMNLLKEIEMNDFLCAQRDFFERR